MTAGLRSDLWILGPEHTIEVGYARVQKHGEIAAGDTIRLRRLPGEERVIVVLSDGLGSGVKASVLSSLTATMALEYATSDIEPERVGGIIMRTLPVCSLRKIRYATFTACNMRASGACDIVNFDNPGPFLVDSNGWALVDLDTRSHPPQNAGATRSGRIRIARGQYLVTVSDGVTQAGMGSDRFPLGWGVEAVGAFLSAEIQRRPGISAQSLADRVVETAVAHDHGRAKDDISCAAIYRRRPRRLLVATGPPIDRGRDADIAAAVARFPGRRVLAGGTTANLVARELGRNVTVNLRERDPHIPPTSSIDGIDLVTEGTITVSRAVELLEQGGVRPDDGTNGATRLVEALLESDEIHFVVGTKINEAHQNPSVPVELAIRRNLIKTMSSLLEERYLKRTRVRFV